MQFITRRKPTWPQRFDGKDFDADAQRLYGMKGIPATFLIDREGRVVGINIKGKALEPAVRKFLGLDTT